MKHSDWYYLLKDRLGENYFFRIKQFIDEQYSNKTVYPAKDNIFRALKETSYSNTKIVILGQDPYHGPKQAQGLSFSVPEDIAPPPSLVNILKELKSDIGEKRNHDLTSWAKQGVLLLNSCLTVEKSKPNSHQGLIWEIFTDEMISLLNEKEDSIVFILWGAFARKKKTLITSKHHCIIESSHPSPLSVYRGFWGSKPFSKANKYLISTNQLPIDWLK